MKITVVRDTQTEVCTFGKLYIDGQYICHTLEDVIRQIDDQPVSNWKVPGATAIPTGKYNMVLSMSNRFKIVLPEIQKVEGFTGIRIHSGNTDKDTEGCILLGMRRDGNSVSQSRIAMNLFMSTISKAKKMTIEVTNDFHKS